MTPLDDAAGNHSTRSRRVPTPRRAATRTPAGNAREPGTAAAVPGNPRPALLPQEIPQDGGLTSSDREAGLVPAGRPSLPSPPGAVINSSPAPVRGRPGSRPGDAVDADAASSGRPAAHQAIAAAMTEDRGADSLDAHVRRLLRDLSLSGYHTKDSRRSARGYPDWTIAGPGGVIWRELKTQRGRVAPEQQAWLDILAAGGGNAGVWRPIHLLSGQIARELAALAGLRGAA